MPEWKNVDWGRWYLRAQAIKRDKGLVDADLSEQIAAELKEGPGMVERGAVNHWLNGKRQPKLAQFLALCKVLDVSPHELLFGTPPTEAGGRRGDKKDEKTGKPIYLLTHHESQLVQIFRRLQAHPDEQNRIVEFAEDRLARTLLTGGGKVTPLLRDRRRTSKK
jgi:transcriptional regulator with XRE-family HTH domain